MPYYTKYHLGEQSAYALLGPIHAGLRELEQRTQHYTRRLSLSDTGSETLDAAHRALAQARAEVERLWREAEHGERGERAGRASEEHAR